MRGILSKNNDPYFNLAAEEYFLKNADDEIFILWQSFPTVVVGKHQNVLAEINYRFIKKNDIRVARRLTGGGAVFHDLGNLNFSFIRSGEPGKLVDFNRFVAPVIRFLDSLGIKATQGEKHELFMAGLKISGNAEHVYKNRVLHHGTLLFNTNMEMLHEAIKISPGRYKDKAVASNRSGVINIADSGLNGTDIQEFISGLFNFILGTNDGKEYSINDSEKNSINELSLTKYTSWNWIFGWSPDYSFSGDIIAGEFRFLINLLVHRGIIMDCNVTATDLAKDITGLLNRSLRGVPHNEESVRQAVKDCGLNDILSKKDFEELVFGFF